MPLRGNSLYMIILTARYICNRQMRRLRFPWTCIPSRRVAGYFFWRALTSPCRVRLGMATLRLRFERKLIESNAGRRPNGRLCELRSNTHACVRKRNTPPPGGVFLLRTLACGFERTFAYERSPIQHRYLVFLRSKRCCSVSGIPRKKALSLGFFLCLFAASIFENGRKIRDLLHFYCIVSQKATLSLYRMDLELLPVRNVRRLAHKQNSQRQKMPPTSKTLHAFFLQTERYTAATVPHRKAGRTGCRLR